MCAIIKKERGREREREKEGERERGKGRERERGEREGEGGRERGRERGGGEGEKEKRDIISRPIPLYITTVASPNVTAAPVQSVLITDNATLTCSIIAKPTNFTAAWYHNNIIINEVNSGKYYSTQDLSSSVLIITNVTLEDAGAYRCLISNRHGNGSSTTMLHVQSKEKYM